MTLSSSPLMTANGTRRTAKKNNFRMLHKVQRKKNLSGGGTFVIVASRYNPEFVDAMLHARREGLLRAGARVVRVPGEFEIPAAAAKVAGKDSVRAPRLSAIICLGVIFQGETSH